jgi:hypothetical protein
MLVNLSRRQLPDTVQDEIILSQRGDMDIVQQIKTKILPDMIIPKPHATADFTVKGWGKRRGEDALIYYIPNHKNPNKPYQKGITVGEWRQAYDQISHSGGFTRHWFDQNMSACSKEGGCNFTTIGGIFEILGLVKYRGDGLYKSRSSSVDKSIG